MTRFDAARNRQMAALLADTLAHNRRIAAALADTLAPLIADLPDDPPVAVTQRIYSEADKAVIRAAEQVAAAVDQLEQSKYSPGEISAQQDIIKSAYSLRTAWRARLVKSTKFQRKLKGTTHE